MTKKKSQGLELDSVVLKTALSPKELAESIGGSVEWTEKNSVTEQHVVFMKRCDVDEIYRQRTDELCERLDAVSAHVKAGRIAKEAEHDVAWCLQWTLEQMELMQAEQKKLVQWLMQANQEVNRLERKSTGSQGGSKGAEHWRLVAQEAVRIAREKGLADGTHSSEFVASEIEGEVRAFARLNGRDFPGETATRKISSYLRKAGIKKSK